MYDMESLRSHIYRKLAFCLMTFRFDRSHLESWMKGWCKWWCNCKYWTWNVTIFVGCKLHSELQFSLRFALLSYQVRFYFVHKKIRHRIHNFLCIFTSNVMYLTTNYYDSHSLYVHFVIYCNSERSYESLACKLSMNVTCWYALTLIIYIACMCVYEGYR